MSEQKEKQLAAWEAVKLVKQNMIVGLGSGSTSTFMIKKLGEAVANGLSIQGVPSSNETATLARKVGIPLISLEEAVILDINIDGADEFNPIMQLIKGGGGALLREKIIAHNSKINVIITDSSKQVVQLGKFKLPIEVIPFAAKSISVELENMELQPKLRKSGGTVYKTDENNCIVDINILGNTNLNALEIKLKSIPGIVETGLFLDTTDFIIIGKNDSTLMIKKD